MEGSRKSSLIGRGCAFAQKVVGGGGSSWVPLSPPPPLICPLPASPPQSIIRVVFHDRRLQYTEHQQLEGWRWSRPGDRILDIGESPGPEQAQALRHSGVLPGHLADPCLCWASQRTPVLCETSWEWARVNMLLGLLPGSSPFGGKEKQVKFKDFCLSSRGGFTEGF